MGDLCHSIDVDAASVRQTPDSAGPPSAWVRWFPGVAAWLESLPALFKHVPSDPELKRLFRAEVKQQTIQRGAIACIISMALVPVFLYLDLIRIPGSPSVEIFGNLSILLCIRSIYVYLKTPTGRRMPEPLLLFGFLYSSFMIELMIYQSGGFSSEY